MKVHDQVQSQLNQLQRPRRPDAAPSSTRQAAPRRPAPGADLVEMSDLAGEMQKAALGDEARHAERLVELRARIASGDYQVDPRELAQAILREEIHPWTAK